VKLAAEGADNRGEFAFGGVGVGDKGFTMETFFRDNGVDEAFRGGGDDQGNAVAVGDAFEVFAFIIKGDGSIYFNNPQLCRGVTSANHDRDVVALGEMEHQTAKLFERRRVFGRRVMSLRATVAGIERRHAPVQLPPLGIIISS
jgi:hypothetical protein